jgi:prepilin-type N-terminal cleavage/methylation domain-containing protein
VVRKRKTAFTLVEVLVASAVMGVIAFLVPQALSKIYQLFTVSQARIECQRDLRDCVFQIEKDLNQARSSTVRVSRDINQPVFSKIVFQTVAGSTTTYRQDGRRLIVNQGGGDLALTRNLMSVAFLLNEMGQTRSVHVALVVGKDGDRLHKKTFSTLLRNIVFKNS